MIPFNSCYGYPMGSPRVSHKLSFCFIRWRNPMESHDVPAADIPLILPGRSPRGFPMGELSIPVGSCGGSPMSSTMVPPQGYPPVDHLRRCPLPFPPHYSGPAEGPPRESTRRISRGSPGRLLGGSPQRIPWRIPPRIPLRIPPRIPGRIPWAPITCIS